MTKTSCIIVCYKSKRFHQKLLNSIKSQTLAVDEVIFIDNESSRATKTFCNKNNIKYYSPGNIGYGQACNYGAENAKGEYLLFLNPDLILSNNLVHEFEKKITRKIGILSCIVYSYDGKKITNDYGKLDRLGRPIRTNEKDNLLINGCTIFCNKITFNKLGGFSKEFFMYGEDTDLALRSAKLGYKNIVLNSTSVWHYGGGSQNNKYEKIPNIIKAIIKTFKNHIIK